MFSFHKPKIYRSLTGCCICRAKSSSSRFTDSGKYQPYFGACFHLKEERSGDICNACVLLVKRFRKLPSGVSGHRHWGHVVDARANTKVRSKMSITEKVDVEEEDETTRVVAADEDDDEMITKVSLRKKKKQREREQRENQRNRCWNHHSRNLVPAKLEINPMPSFLDPQLWRRETVCCGVIFRGPQNAVVIDTNYFRPCESRRRLLDRDQGSSAGTSSPSSSSPSASLSPASASPPTSTEINFKMDSTGDDQRSECDSETNFDDRNFTDGQNGHSKMAVPAAF